MRRPRALPKLAVLALFATLLAGCGPTEEPCRQSRSDAEDALLALLEAAHDNDPNAAQRVLKPGLTVDEELFARLHDALEGARIEDFKITDHDQLSTAHSYRVFSGAGELIGNFEVHEIVAGCFATAWGNTIESG